MCLCPYLLYITSVFVHTPVCRYRPFATLPFHFSGLVPLCMYMCMHESILLCMYMHACIPLFPSITCSCIPKAAKGKLTAVYNYFIWGYTQDGARLFSEVHGDGVRGNRHKLEHQKFQLDIRIFFSYHKGG